MPDARPVKSSHHPGQPGKLNRLPHREPSQHRQNSQPNRSSVSMLLQRVIRLAYRRLGAEKEVMLHHRPHARNIPRRKQNLPIVPAEKLIAEIQNARRHVNPHEGQVPLQRASQPPANGEGLRPVQQIFLRNLGPKARKGPENLQSAAHHHKQRNRVNPVAQPHHKRMFVNRPRNDHWRFFFAVSALYLGLNNLDNCAAHDRPSNSSPHKITIRKTTNTPDLPNTQLCRGRSSPSSPSSTLPACSQSWWESANAAAPHAPA